MVKSTKKEDFPNYEDEAFVRREDDMNKLEKAVRQTASSGFRGNRFTAPFVNSYAASLVLVFHLISIESLVSIGMSVFLAICKFLRYEACFDFGLNLLTSRLC